MPKVTFRSKLPVSAEELFAWHAAPGAFARLAPPFESIQLEGEDEGLHDGDRRVLLIGLGPLKLRWTAAHDAWVDGRQFRDIQVNGPFARWEHTHRCRPDESGGCWLEDELDYRLPLAPVTEPFARLALQSRLRRTFLFRHWRTRFDLLRRIEAPGGKIVLSGGQGLVGQELQRFLSVLGFEVVRLVRRQPRCPQEFHWDPYANACPTQPLEGAQALIHLSGHHVMDGSWDEAHRRKMWDSRVLTTRCLVQTMARLNQPPSAFICASGVGYYASGTQPVDEEGSGATGFLADLVRAWEGEASQAQTATTRAVQLRLGAVLSARGGALKEMLLPFSLGVGATIGGGGTPFNWIGMEDLLGVVLHAIQSKELKGPVNAVGPQQLDFRAFADVLARCLGRPRFLDVPPALLRPFLGAKLDLLLEGAPVVPRKLMESGFTFLLPQVEQALRHELGRHGDWLPERFDMAWD